MFDLGNATKASTLSPIETAVEVLNKYEATVNHIVLEDGVLYTTPAKDECVTVEFAAKEIQDAQNMLDAIAGSSMVGGTQYHWSQKRDNWKVVQDYLNA